jgi:hypothetical protein
MVPQPDGTPPLRLEWVEADTLADNPSNWRRHPDGQLGALREVLAEVGWAGALLYNEQTRRLIDGHARKQLAPGKVPVLVGAWTEAQEKVILASLDPIAGMAEADADRLEALLHEVNPTGEAVRALLADLAARAGVEAGLPLDPAEEWQGMPEFTHEDQTAYRSILVHFKRDEDVESFARIVGQAITEGTKFIWHPQQVRIPYGRVE